MNPRKLILICVITWAVAVVLSFVHPFFTAPSGDELVKGMNLIGIWIGWQVGALMFAIAALIVRLTRGAELSPPMRILAVAPIGASLFAVAGIAFFLYRAG